MAVPDKQPAGPPPKVKPKTAIIVIGIAAVGGYLYLRSRGSSSGTAAGTSSGAGAGTVTTSYGLGPQWVLTAVKDLHSPPKRKPKRGMTDWQGRR